MQVEFILQEPMLVGEDQPEVVSDHTHGISGVSVSVLGCL